MFNKTVIIFLLAITPSFAQLKDVSKFKLNNTDIFASVKESKGLFLKNNLFDSLQKANNNITQTRVKKSPGLAMIYSLFVPGMGQIYTKRFDVGKYFLISEAALWTAFASFTLYGNWLLTDSYNFSVLHAGVTKGDKAKDDNFWVNISNYDNVEQYNNDMLERGNYDQVYYPGTGFDFAWDNVANRENYRIDKLSGDRIKNDRLFLVGAILLNHLISAVSAIILTNRYNNGDQTSGGVSIKADVVKNYNNRVDGIKLNLIKWF